MSVLKKIQSIFLGLVSLARGCRRDAPLRENQTLMLRGDLICLSVLELGLEPRSPELMEHFCCMRHLIKLCGI